MPLPPWTLEGQAILGLYLIDYDRVRHLIPPELNIVSVFPGKTVGGVYLSDYREGSVLQYSELIVIAAFTQHGGHFGGWISHIYVDNADSVAGGREIWGLPKELAEFSWDGDRSVSVRQGNQRLCTLNYNPQGFGWRQSLAASAFSTMNGNLLTFKSELDSHLSLIGSHLEVFAESPFLGLGLGQPFLTVRCDDMTLRVAAPQVI